MTLALIVTLALALGWNIASLLNIEQEPQRQQNEKGRT